jgi:hypothetical protein
MMEAMGDDAKEDGEDEREDPLEDGRGRSKEGEVGFVVPQDAFAFDPASDFETGRIRKGDESRETKRDETEWKMYGPSLDEESSDSTDAADQDVAERRDGPCVESQSDSVRG